MGTWNINEKNTFSLVITALKVMCTDEKEWNCALSWLIKNYFRMNSNHQC